MIGDDLTGLVGENACSDAAYSSGCRAGDEGERGRDGASERHGSGERFGFDGVTLRFLAGRDRADRLCDDVGRLSRVLSDRFELAEPAGH